MLLVIRCNKHLHKHIRQAFISKLVSQKKPSSFHNVTLCLDVWKREGAQSDTNHVTEDPNTRIVYSSEHGLARVCVQARTETSFSCKRDQTHNIVASEQYTLYTIYCVIYVLCNMYIIVFLATYIIVYQL